MHLPNELSVTEQRGVWNVPWFCMRHGMHRNGHNVPVGPDLFWQHVPVSHFVSCSEFGSVWFATRVGLWDRVQWHWHDVLLGAGLLGRCLHLPDELPFPKHNCLWGFSGFCMRPRM